MITFHDSIEVSQKPDRVFAFISDLNNLPKFQAEVVQSRVITPGPVRLGTRFEELVKLGPWRVPTQCVVTEFDEQGKLAFEASSKPVKYEGAFTVEPAAPGSRVTIRGIAQLQGLWRLLQPLLAGDVRKGLRHELLAIKRHTEGEVSDT